jgi:ABC-type molybdate transport system substrate-binding protein
MGFGTASWVGGALLAASVSVAEQEPVRLYAAGSLRVALTEVALAFEKAEILRMAWRAVRSRAA